MFHRAALLLSLAACTAADTGKSDPTDTATTTDTTDTATTITSPLCDEPDVLDGTLPTSWWQADGGDPVFLAPEGGPGVFGQDCYGGHVDGALTVAAGAFDWAGRMYDGAGSPDPESVRVVGCVTETQMDVRILTSAGEAFWGPWSLTRTDTALDYEFCD